MGAALPVDEPWRPRGSQLCSSTDACASCYSGAFPVQPMRTLQKAATPYRLAEHRDNLAFLHSPIRMLLALLQQSQVDNAATKIFTCPYDINTCHNEYSVSRDLTQNTQRIVHPPHGTAQRQAPDVMAGTASHSLST